MLNVDAEIAIEKELLFEREIRQEQRDAAEQRLAEIETQIIVRRARAGLIREQELDAANSPEITLEDRIREAHGLPPRSAAPESPSDPDGGPEAPSEAA